MSAEIWFALVAVVTYAGARIAKAWPKFPKAALPWLALALGYAITALKLHFVDALGWGAALSEAWTGLAAGLVAVGGHSALRPTLAATVGDAAADKILGRLPKPTPKARAKKDATPASIVFIACALMGLSGCGAVMSALAAAGQGSQWLASALDVAEAGSDAYFARHPSLERQQQVSTAVRQARLGQAALDAALATAESADAGNIEKARSDALTAYGALKALLDELGVTSAKGPLGGAETEAPIPEPFALPTEADLAARL